MLAQRPQAVSETYAAFYDRLSATRFRPGLAARFTARVRWSSLDQQLVEGADPSGSPQLAARATVLTCAREREKLAAAIDRVVDAAHGPQRRWWAVSRRPPVRANAAELRALAQLLRSSRPLYARGVAVVNQLLTDGCGPLYTARAEGLAWALYEAHGALLG
jgi:hypothetical protein